MLVTFNKYISQPKVIISNFNLAYQIILTYGSGRFGVNIRLNCQKNKGQKSNKKNFKYAKWFIKNKAYLPLHSK